MLHRDVRCSPERRGRSLPGTTVESRFQQALTVHLCAARGRLSHGGTRARSVGCSAADCSGGDVTILFESCQLFSQVLLPGALVLAIEIVFGIWTVHVFSRHGNGSNRVRNTIYRLHLEGEVRFSSVASSSGVFSFPVETRARTPRSAVSSQ